MQVLVIGEILGRLDRLEAVVQQARATHIDAVFMVGNIVAGPERAAAFATRQTASTGGLDLQARVVAETAADTRRYAGALTLLDALKAPVYLIPGERDAPLAALKEVIEAHHRQTAVKLVHRAAARLGSMDVVAGFGGVLSQEEGDDQLLLRFRPWETRVCFEHLHTFDRIFQLGRQRIFLFATAPSSDLRDAPGDVHLGAHVLNQIIRQYQPHLVCCGGTEHGRGVERIEGAYVVNPGSVAQGSYAMLEVDGAHVEVRLRRVLEPQQQGVAQFRRIVVALDGSGEAWRCLELAVRLARSASAQLVLMHAFEPIPPEWAEPFLSAAIADRMRIGEQLLEEAASSIADLPVERELVEGPAADAIVRVGLAHRADLIVMGARGLGAVRALLGGVSNRVMRAAPCPVLIAP